MKDMKILINVPRGKHGGVANYYAGLSDKFKLNIVYNYTGGRSNTKMFLFYILFDYLIFVFKLIKINPDIVHLNPSLDKKSTIREGVFLVIAKLFKKKVIVFWRGWRKDIEEEITIKYSSLFMRIYGKADSFIVLANDFKNALVKWGVKKTIHTETTQINDSLIKDFHVENKTFVEASLLFLARVEKNKGIYETINAVKLLNKNDPNISLTVAGSGAELEQAKQYVQDNQLKNIKFIGYVFNENKIAAFKKSNIYIFPTYYGEGMPNSVLEAMGFGLPVITRPVGGLKDFFEDGKMGYITESKDPKVFADLIENLISNKEKMKEISKYNHEYAKENFLASKVAKRLEKIYENTIYAKENQTT